jgi:hypothetical protein
MPHHDAYVLHIWRSRATSGRQWAARLDHLPGGESLRFSDPAVLLAHLQALVQAGEHSEPPVGADGPARTTEEGGAQEGS